ncbi:hypothetical protein CPB85DRAFT_1328559 [Mucidula mucida]|nr:hypothetical protein CPB85DRAFT_1328559 [Mucidula mucida]
MSTRAFRACLHCRSRKARCDLGNVDSPKEPPCARCKREGQKCEFAPSRRGGSRQKLKAKCAMQQAPAVRQPSTSFSTASDDSAASYPSVDAEKLAATSLHNPEDAVMLLVLASEAVNDGRTADKAPPGLLSFPLIAQGILTIEQFPVLVDIFFTRMHYFFPMVPNSRIPRSADDIVRFAAEEQDLASVIVVISSRYMNDGEWKGLHERAWAHFKTRLADLISGQAATIGTVEALLLLSEYLPRITSESTADLHDEENRTAWMLVGTAVRLGYMMGLDQKTFISVPSTPTESVIDSDNHLNRERLAWTYCYMFDRQISIRIGKAFWSRGPGLCFHSPGDKEPSAYTNFPSLRPVPGLQDDYASVVQAYVDLTQTMTNAHDILYPSKDRTIALVRVGEYYKYLDAFTRSINGFRMDWENKRWETQAMADCVWISFHYLRLYISSFAFQAHIQRAMPAFSSSNTNPARFTWDILGGPDAKFILEGIDAATELLKICVNRLHPNVGLSFLPWRFFLFFSYAAVFLLKALFIDAIVTSDQPSTVRLLKHLIVCLSTDSLHPGARYARLLNGLLKTFCQGKDYYSETRCASPSPQMDIEMGQQSTSMGGLDPTAGMTAGGGLPPSDIDLDWFDLTNTSLVPGPEEFSYLLSDHEALDNEFWRYLSTQAGDWNRMTEPVFSWDLPV